MLAHILVPVQSLNRKLSGCAAVRMHMAWPTAHSPGSCQRADALLANLPTLPCVLVLMSYFPACGATPSPNCVLQTMSDMPAVRVDDAFKQYLKEIAQAIDGATHDADQVITSAFQELDGKEVVVATDVECSRFLEKLISSASPVQAIDLLGRIASRDALYTVACKCVPHVRILCHCGGQPARSLLYIHCATIYSQQKKMLCAALLVRMFWSSYCFRCKKP